MNKKRIIICFILVILLFSWIAFIYRLSDMNTYSSNGKSISIISVFIDDTLDVTNKYGITNSNPSDSKLDKVSKLLNAPLRKVIHATVYFVMAIIIAFLVNFVLENKKYWLTIIITLALVIGLASFDEYHQTHVEGRTGQVKDVIIDTAGGVTGILFYSTYYVTYYIASKKYYKKGLEESNKKLKKK